MNRGEVLVSLPHRKFTWPRATAVIFALGLSAHAIDQDAARLPSPSLHYRTVRSVEYQYTDEEYPGLASQGDDIPAVIIDCMNGQEPPGDARSDEIYDLVRYCAVATSIELGPIQVDHAAIAYIESAGNIIG